MGEKDGKGGGSTPFESMPHDQMLAWLDQAESQAVQTAADSLAAAAGEIRSIAQELKFRPERVEWKGEGNQAFVEWGASLAGATFRLAEYSDEASKWLGRASEAITEAQSSIPREKSPIAKAVMPPSPLAPIPEMDRLEAAAQMRRLAQSYQQSQTQMGKLELPTFQPPPTEFVPEGGSRDLTESLGRTGGGDGPSMSGSGTYVASPQGGSASAQGIASVPSSGIKSVESPVAMEVDSIDTRPQSPVAPPGTSGGTPPVGKPDGMGLPVTGMIPPAFSGGTGPQGPGTARGRSAPGARSPLLPGQSPAGTGPTGRLPQNNGISGGRPVPTSSGRPSGGIPRGAVIGGEQNHGRTPMGRGIGGGMGGMGGGQSGITGGRRLASEAGGVVGGRPAQPGTRTGRPFTPGGSGLVRGAAADGGARSGQTAVPPGSRRGASRRRDDPNGERPDYLIEDEETWQQGGRRVVPPVID